MDVNLHCTICGTPLSGGLDTYGDVGRELCQRCDLELSYESASDAASDEAWGKLFRELQEQEWAWKEAQDAPRVAYRALREGRGR